MSATYATAADSAKTVRQQIKKELGYNARQVSVRCSNYSGGSSLRVTIKAKGLDVAAIERIAQGEQKVSRCEFSGEILSGGNRFVFVSLDWDLESAERELVEPEVSKAVAKLDAGEEHTVWLSEGYELFRCSTGETGIRCNGEELGRSNHYGTPDWMRGQDCINSLSRQIAQHRLCGQPVSN